METPSGKAKLRIRPNAELGTLDHDFDAPEASWTVPARVETSLKYGSKTEMSSSYSKNNPADVLSQY